IKTNVKAALQVMGLKGLEAKYPRILSFGQKRRLGVAAALALNPRMLILDEITNGQDAAEQTAMMEYLKALNEEKGTTIILITHDMNVVRKYARRAIVLTDGHLVFSGTPQELFEGNQPVERWGLRRPVVSELASRLGVSAATCEEFCEVVGKGGVTL
ncbi:MAG: ATP-binding cassette domain-containing protein, partial [Acidaminococcaceae bacterium]|nr:ATP-binding cassette domain-containing protein [Acidaminococcaceae bacterium]